MEIIIETPRLILRKYEMSDFDELSKILTDKETMKFYPKPYDENGVMRWINWNLENYQKYNFGLYVVVLKETNTFIGNCGITMQNINNNIVPEVGFHINKLYWNKGYATESAKHVLEYFFANFDYQEVYCYQSVLNKASRAVAEKIGLKHKLDYKKGDEELSVYSIKRNDYYKNR